jgi:hypothetical protein
MRILRFTFRNEALWMICFALVIPLIGLLSLVILMLFKW